MLIKKLILMANIVLCLTTSLVAYAAETYAPPFEYGEMKDGLFVRTLDEELEGVPKELFWEERAKAIKARKLDELTPEMKEAGYILVNGDAILSTQQGEQAEYEGRTSEFDANAKTGFITFAGVVESIIKEPIYINIAGIDDAKFYKTFPIFEENKWISTVTLPIGKYAVVSGGIAKDFKSKYPLKIQNEIIVEENANCVVNFTVGNINTIIQEKTDTPIDESKLEAEKSEETPPEEEPKKEKFNVLWLIPAIVVIGIIVGFGYKGVKKLNKYLYH